MLSMDSATSLTNQASGNPKPGNEDSKVNKFLTGLSSELDKNFTEKKTFTNRIRDCFEEGQRMDIKRNSRHGWTAIAGV